MLLQTVAWPWPLSAVPIRASGPCGVSSTLAYSVDSGAPPARSTKTATPTPSAMPSGVTSAAWAKASTARSSA